MPDVAVNQVSLDVRVKFGESPLLNRMAELFDSFSSRIRFTHFCPVFNCIFSLLKAASDVISGLFVRPIVLAKCVTF